MNKNPTATPIETNLQYTCFKTFLHESKEDDRFDYFHPHQTINRKTENKISAIHMTTLRLFRNKPNKYPCTLNKLTDGV